MCVRSPAAHTRTHQKPASVVGGLPSLPKNTAQKNQSSQEHTCCQHRQKHIAKLHLLKHQTHVTFINQHLKHSQHEPRHVPAPLFPCCLQVAQHTPLNYLEQAKYSCPLPGSSGGLPAKVLKAVFTEARVNPSWRAASLAALRLHKSLFQCLKQHLLPETMQKAEHSLCHGQRNREQTKLLSLSSGDPTTTHSMFFRGYFTYSYSLGFIMYLMSTCSWSK